MGSNIASASTTLKELTIRSPFWDSNPYGHHLSLGALWKQPSPVLQTLRLCGLAIEDTSIDDFVRYHPSLKYLQLDLVIMEPSSWSRLFIRCRRLPHLKTSLNRCVALDPSAPYVAPTLNSFSAFGEKRLPLIPVIPVNNGGTHILTLSELAKFLGDAGTHDQLTSELETFLQNPAAAWTEYLESKFGPLDWHTALGR